MTADNSVSLCYFSISHNGPNKTQPT